MFEMATSKEMWSWAYCHPYLFTVIKLGTPSVYAIILYAGTRIITKALGGRR
jgi:hypothetical protein